MTGLQLYFPRAGEHADDVLAAWLAVPTRRLWLAIYAINRKAIASAIMLQQQSGADVQLIVDHLQSSGAEQLATLQVLRAAGVPIKTNHHAGLMHMKLAVRGNPPASVALGSFNWTNNAEELNDEVLGTADSSEQAAHAAAVFECMWQDETRFRPWTPPTREEMHAAMAALPQF